MEGGTGIFRFCGSTWPQRVFTQKCYHHHYRQIWMRTIHTNIQPSSPLYPTHHSQTFMSFHRCHNIFKSAFMVAFRLSKNFTNLLVRVNLCNPSQNNTPHPSRGFCNAAVIVLRAPKPKSRRHLQNVQLRMIWCPVVVNGRVWKEPKAWKPRPPEKLWWDSRNSFQNEKHNLIYFLSFELDNNSSK